MIFTDLDTVLYHNDSLESTSEQELYFETRVITYIIMTRWSQLQNATWSPAHNYNFIS